MVISSRRTGAGNYAGILNHVSKADKSRDDFVNTYERNLKECIGIIAVMRLAIEPLPVLLRDEEILYRCFDSMTEPYADTFVEEYIGEETISAYKETELYRGTYDAFIIEEKKNQATFEVVKHQYIDTNKMEDLKKQLHLMTKIDATSVLIADACIKVTKVYTYGGLLMYFTDRETNRKEQSWSSDDFNNFADASNLINQKYDEAFMSVFKDQEECYYVEHNESLEDMEALSIQNAISLLYETTGK